MIYNYTAAYSWLWGAMLFFIQEAEGLIS
jgi:hypothetical protein